MNDKRMVEEVEVEGLEVADLGDASKETRHYHPTQVILDSSFQIGRPFTL